MKKYSEFITELAIERAYAFAKDAHSGQVRKSSGKPYVVHPTAVFKLLKKVGVKDRNVLVSALLHDTIEDSPATYNIIVKKFNKDVGRIVKELSSSMSGISKLGKPKYLASKMTKMNSDALLIKLADRWHNIQDMGDMPSKKAKQYISQTMYIVGELRLNRNLSTMQKKIIRSIEKTIDKFSYLIDPELKGI